ncbi:MAG: hypothetical protein CMA72_09285 [Euryarchaeota archaeon]|jgi:hypothetical protein|nr:hypothetical protein [Euryarchaeota archaeon]|tara:strand:- start:2888 stop:3181 length:294 start_codon:yes stop_codon:yes gene_type:complete
MKAIFTFFIFSFFVTTANSQEKTKLYNFKALYIKVQHKKSTKTKFYNFDDLLINGQYKKPQVLYTDAKQKVRFEKLLKLKRDFLPKLKNTSKDPSLR